MNTPNFLALHGAGGCNAWSCGKVQSDNSSCFVIPYLPANPLKAVPSHSDTPPIPTDHLPGDTCCPPPWVTQCYLSDGCSPAEYAVYLLRPGFMVSKVEPNIYYWGMTSRHIVTVSCWNIHVWHFAQQNLLMEEMTNSPWWEKTKAELPESSRKKHHFVSGFQILQDISSRTCTPFPNSATGWKTPTRSGVLMPNCLWPVTSVHGSISTWPWDACILLVSSEGNLPSSGPPQTLLAFSWPYPVSAAWGSMPLKEFIPCSKILLGPHCPKSSIFHYFLSWSQYFLSSSPLLTNILL